MEFRNRVVHIGPYKIDSNSSEIILGNSRSSVEPMVIKLILALYDNHHKYVTITELMSMCWEGRFVSEVTVRTAIAKARKSLRLENGSHEYIVSKPKIGYKLVKEVPYLKSDEEHLIRRIAPKVIWFIPSVLLLITMLIILNKDTETIPIERESSHLEYERVATFQGDLNAFSISDDEKYYAFSIRRSPLSQFELQIFDTSTKTSVSLELDTNNIVSTTFLPESHDLLVADLSYMESRILRISPINGDWLNGIEAEVILDELKTINSIASYSESVAFASISTDTTPYSTVHLLDLNTLSISAILPPPSDSIIDRSLAVNRNTGELAILREVDKNKNLILYNIVEESYMQSHLGELDLEDIFISSASNLYLVGKISYRHTNQGLEALDNTNTKRIVGINNSNVYYVGKDSRASTSYIRESNLRTDVESYIEVPQEIIKAYYHSQNSYLLLCEDDNELLLYNLNNGRLNYLGHAFNKTASVVSRNEFEPNEFIIATDSEVYIYNFDNNDLIELRDVSGTVGSATFDISGNRVLLTQRKYGAWELSSYDKEGLWIKKLKEGLRSIVTFRDSYLAIKFDRTILNLSPDFTVVENIKFDTTEQYVDIVNRTLSFRVIDGSKDFPTDFPIKHSPYLSPEFDKILSIQKELHNSSIYSTEERSNPL